MTPGIGWQPGCQHGGMSANGTGEQPTRPCVFDVRTVTRSGGGPEKTILLGARYLAERGWPVHCIYLHPPGDPGFQALRRKAQTLEVPLVEIEDRGPLDFRTVKRLLRLCRTVQPAIWHGHDYKADALGWLIHRFYPMRLVSTVHGWGVPGRRVKFYHFIHRLCLRGFDKVFCVSAELRTVCLQAGIVPSICEVLENGVDCNEFRMTGDRSTAKRLLGLPPDQVVLGYVGRLSPEKNLALLIETLADLSRRGCPAYVVIVGDGSERAALSALAERLGIASRVLFTGYVADPRPYYSAMDAFLLPSHSEGLPNVLLEAMAMELPSVCTAVGGIPQVIRHEENGLLLPSASTAAIVDAVLRLRSNPDLCRRLGRAAREYVATSHSFFRRMERLCAEYVRLVESSAGV